MQLNLLNLDQTDSSTFICLDIETTGFSYEDDQIIEIAAVKFSGDNQIDTFQTLIYTEQAIPIIVQDLTGIKNTMLAGKPLLADVKAQLLDFVGNYPIIGHNINFDLDFLGTKGIVIPGKRIDTFPMSQTLVPNAISYSLETLSYHLVTHQPTHRALDDVLANIELFNHLAALWQYKQTPETIQIVEKSTLPYKEYFLSLPKTTTPPQKEIIDTTPLVKLPAALGTPPNKTITVGTNEQLIALKTDFPNCQIITPHYQLIDPAKFEQLLAQPELTTDETYACLKVCLNKLNNQLPSTNDINLFGKEYNIISPLTYATQQPVKIDDTTFYAISHNYFFQQLQATPPLNDYLKNTKLIFLDHPFLEEAYTRASTTTIHYNNFPQGEADLAFGLLGIFAQKFHDANSYGPLLMEDFHFTQPEWQNAKDAFAKLNITFPNPQQDLIWINSNDDRPPTLQYISKGADFNLEQIINAHGLNMEIIKYTVETEAKITVYPRLPVPNGSGYDATINQKIDYLITNSSKDICIVTTNYTQIKEIYQYCLNKFPHRNVIAQKYSGSAGKISHKITEVEGHNILICTYQFYLQHTPPMANLERLILVKLPIMTPHHPFYSFKEKVDSNYFNHYVIPHTLNNLLQTINIGQHAENIDLLDSRIETTNYGQTIKTGLSNYVEFTTWTN
ncbi:hypothetical protein COV81_00820 [Candidatus Peregrinibacteria bacterium CG11_big_fil_rev_8_21_14_0_20_41_10]|nr:MAG: hypothetical protein COV81_00820 [Candidatus Peregrinibacteria bacterium CG11_big_fil_rev_8_21_14_0_20_41_10]